MLGTILLCRIISVNGQYLKLFNGVPKLNDLYYVAILGNIWLCVNEWIVLNRIISVKCQYF